MAFRSLRSKSAFFSSQKDGRKRSRKRVSDTDEVTLKLMCSESRKPVKANKSLLEVNKVWQSRERAGFEKWNSNVQIKRLEAIHEVSFTLTLSAQNCLK